MRTAMTEDQRQMASAFVRRLNIPDVEPVELHNGYRLRLPRRSYFGYLRFNVSNSQGNAGMYTVYAYRPFDDEEGRFINRGVNQGNAQWLYVINPTDEDAMTYAVGMLKSASDRH